MSHDLHLQIPNDEMYWVVTTIVSETRADSRAKFIKHFVKIASKFLPLSLLHARL